MRASCRDAFLRQAGEVDRIIRLPVKRLDEASLALAIILVARIM